MFRVIRSGKRKSKLFSAHLINMSCVIDGMFSLKLIKQYLLKAMYKFLAAKQWKRMVTKATFVGPAFTRKPPKYERFIRPSGLRFTKAHVTHPELKCTFNLEIIGVKKNPNGSMYTSLGVMTKGTVIEVISFFTGSGPEKYTWFT